MTSRNSLPGLTHPIRLSPENTDSAEPATASAPEGSIYVAWVEHRKRDADVMIVRIKSDGQVAGPAVRVNSKPGIATAWRGDPPTVAVAPDETVFVGWTARTDSEDSHADDLYLSSSRDHGLTFGTPVKVNDDSRPAVHGMHSLAVARDGRVYVAWLDERNLAPAPMKDMKMDSSSSGRHTESNREVFIASSTDGGRSFSPNQKVAGNVCPCCKTALAISNEDRVYLSWRQVLPGDFRHIAVASSIDQGKTFSSPKIVSDDQWMLTGCPVSGPSLLITDAGRLRVLWYSEGKSGSTGLYWAESSDQGATFGPRHLLAAETTRGTPVMLNSGSVIWQSSENNSGKISFAQTNDASQKNRFVVAGAGELPAAVLSGGRIFVSYLLKGAEGQAIWLVTARDQTASLTAQSNKQLP